MLHNRKGWQKKSAGSNGPLRGKWAYHCLSISQNVFWDQLGNVYEIYEQRDTPDIDMYCHFLKRQLGQELGPDDFIFPHIAVNGIVHTKKEIVHDTVQKMLAEFTVNAGLHGTYSTHCFHRGGAQYHFMFAPLGKRWSLSMIHWWGGQWENTCSSLCPHF
jgi:hypothetical protein